MIGKRIQIDDEMWLAIDQLRQERRRSFQQLATEALRDLLEKYHRPVRLIDQLKESVSEGDEPVPAKRGKARPSRS